MSIRQLIIIFLFSSSAFLLGNTNQQLLNGTYRLNFTTFVDDNDCVVDFEITPVGDVKILQERLPYRSIKKITFDVKNDSFEVGPESTQVAYLNVYWGSDEFTNSILIRLAQLQEWKSSTNQKRIVIIDAIQTHANGPSNLQLVKKAQVELRKIEQGKKLIPFLD